MQDLEEYFLTVCLFWVVFKVYLIHEDLQWLIQHLTHQQL